MTDNLPATSGRASGRKRRRNFADINRLFRDVIANETSEQDVIDIWNKLKEVAKTGNVPAMEMVFSRIMGKPSVGAANSLLDHEIADGLQDRYKNMKPEELEILRRAMLRVAGQEDDESPRTVVEIVGVDDADTEGETPSPSLSLSTVESGMEGGGDEAADDGGGP